LPIILNFDRTIFAEHRRNQRKRAKAKLAEGVAPIPNEPPHPGGGDPVDPRREFIRDNNSSGS
jgi:hypothetical protein